MRVFTDPPARARLNCDLSTREAQSRQKIRGNAAVGGGGGIRSLSRNPDQIQMEIFFAYARLLKREREKFNGQRSEIRGQTPPASLFELAAQDAFRLFPAQRPSDQSEGEADLLDQLRLASACHHSEH